MANAFNSMSKEVIFQKLHVKGGDIIQLIPFVHAFYTFESPLFYSHNNDDDDVIVIPSTMGTHQGDPLGRALFALTHFRALHFIVSHFPSYLFRSITNDIHIIGGAPLYHLHMSICRLNCMQYVFLSNLKNV
jgi:hypothetical protein